MKKFMLTSILLTFLAAGTAIMAQEMQEEYLGLPGDNLNLYAVMKLFQESETLEGFEKNLNGQDMQINNLDLDADNMVDYIRVLDNIDRNVHTIVLQVSLNERESQDVAVFTVQKFDDGQVQIQLIGDEELYGKNYIIEPIFDDLTAGQTPNPGYLGNTRANNKQNVTYVRTTTYEIATWPVVRFIYLPTYVGWRSTWYHGYYPPYWNPWRPYYYHYYYGYHHGWNDHYYNHYRRWNNHRYQNYNDYYYVGHRAYSSNVQVRIKDGAYKNTYSRPDQRRDGEAMYTRTHPASSSRTQDRSSGTSTSRRSASPQSETGRKSSETVTNRRSASPQQETGRKSSGTVTNRRSATSTTVNTGSRSTAGESKSVTRTRTSTTTNKSGEKGVSATSRRNASPASGNSAPAAKQKTTRTVKETSKPKESETKKETKRR